LGFSIPLDTVQDILKTMVLPL